MKNELKANISNRSTLRRYLISFLGLLVLVNGWIDRQSNAQRTSGNSRSRPTVTCLIVAPDGKQYVVGSQAGVLGRSFGKASGWSIATKLDHVNSFAFSPDGSVLAIAGGSPAVTGIVELWSWPERKQLVRLEGHKDIVNAVAWLPGRNVLATASADRTLRIWDRQSGRCLETLEGHSGPVLALAVSPDGRWLCSGSVDQTIRIWNTRNWKIRRTLNNHLGTVNDLAFQPGVAKDKPMCLASASEDGTVRIWYPKNGRLVRIVRHKVPVYCLAWNHDGSRLYSGAGDGCVRLMSGEFHRITETRRLTDGWIVSLAVRAEHEQIFAGTTQGNVEFFRPKRHRGEPVLIARPDAFKTLVNPACSYCVTEAKRRAGELKPNDPVLAWTRSNHEGGAIPYRFFLQPYRVISDSYGVFVYDPDAGFARGFERSLDFTFHGWRNGIMVMKHKDGTLFSTLSGRAFAGPRKGQQLHAIPTITTDWSYWSAAYPKSVAYRMFKKYQPIELLKVEHADSLRSRGPTDKRLAGNTPVIGVDYAGKSKAYPLDALQKADGLIRDTIGGKPIFILWYGPTRTAAVYTPDVDGTKAEGYKSTQQISLTREKDGSFVDRETKSSWRIEGRAVDGPLKGRTLRWVNSVQCRWFAWAAEYPETELYSRKSVGN